MRGSDESSSKQPIETADLLCSPHILKDSRRRGATTRLAYFARSLSLLTDMLAPRKTLHSTPLCVFRRALELVAAHPGDVLYDLGCGDGRLVIEAAKIAHIRAVGVEIDVDRCEAARRSAEREGVAHLVTFVCANALEFELPADATIVFLFLIDRGLRCKPSFESILGLD